MPNCQSPMSIRLTETTYQKRMMRWLNSDKSHPQPTHHVWVRCGQCESCLKQKRNEWLLRLSYHYRFQSQPSYFVTLTYDDDHLPAAGVSKKDITLFFKRLRHTASMPFSYFLVSEYGEKTKRAHYHFLLFNYSADPDKILEAWQNGHIFVGNVTNASINYCAKYFITKQECPEGMNENFSRISKGIGKDVLRTNGLKKFAQDHGFLFTEQNKVSLPKYYRDKLCIDSFKLPLHEQPGITLQERLSLMNKVQYNNYIATLESKSKRLINRKNPKF